jgi:hypothetical protein
VPPDFQHCTFRLGLRLHPESCAALGLGCGLHRATEPGCGPRCESGCKPDCGLGGGLAAALGLARSRSVRICNADMSLVHVLYSPAATVIVVAVGVVVVVVVVDTNASNSANLVKRRHMPSEAGIIRL